MKKVNVKNYENQEPLQYEVYMFIFNQQHQYLCYKLRRVCIIKQMLNSESNYAETCNILADNKLEFTSSYRA